MTNAQKILALCLLVAHSLATTSTWAYDGYSSEHSKFKNTVIAAVGEAKALVWYAPLRAPQLRIMRAQLEIANNGKN